jgi:hypothetical protein
MRKLILLLYLFLVVLNSKIIAQVDTSVLKKYSPSVISKVYQVATKVKLPKAKQQELADFYKQEEEEISQAILNNQSDENIKQMQTLFKYELHNILSPSTLDSFYKAQVADKAFTRAEQTSKMLAYKYGNNNQLLNYFKTIYNWQETQLEYIWLRFIDDSVRKENLINTLYTYDTLLNRYKNLSENYIYLNKQIATIKAIQFVDSNKFQQLADSFFIAMSNNKTVTIQKNFELAMQKVFNKLSDTVFYKSLYAEAISEKYWASVVTVMNTYNRTNKISSYTSQKLLPIVIERERNIALIQSVYPIPNAISFSTINQITQNYQHQIDSLLVRDANFESNSQIDIAIRLATELNLSSSIVEELTKISAELNEQKLAFKNENPDAEFDSKAFESDVLNKYLTEDQYTEVLIAKYAKQAQIRMKADWEQMIHFGLHTQYDSTNTKIEFVNYHTAVLISYYRNANDKEKQYASVRMLQEIMPEALRDLYKHWEYKTPYADGVDTFFQW